MRSEVAHITGIVKLIGKSVFQDQNVVAGGGGEATLPLSPYSAAYEHKDLFFWVTVDWKHVWRASGEAAMNEGKSLFSTAPFAINLHNFIFYTSRVAPPRKEEQPLTV